MWNIVGKKTMFKVKELKWKNKYNKKEQIMKELWGKMKIELEKLLTQKKIN